MTTTANPAALDALRALVENPISDRLGLKSGDLKGVVLAGKRALEQGELVEAFDIFKTLVLLDPMSLDHQVGMAETALAAGLNEVAMQCAAVVISISPRRAEGYLLSGRAALAMGEMEAAAEDLAEAVEKAEADKRADLATEARHWQTRLKNTA